MIVVFPGCREHTQSMIGKLFRDWDAAAAYMNIDLENPRRCPPFEIEFHPEGVRSVHTEAGCFQIFNVVDGEA